MPSAHEGFQRSVLSHQQFVDMLMSPHDMVNAPDWLFRDVPPLGGKASERLHVSQLGGYVGGALLRGCITPPKGETAADKKLAKFVVRDPSTTLRRSILLDVGGSEAVEKVTAVAGVELDVYVDFEKSTDDNHPPLAALQEVRGVQAPMNPSERSRTGGLAYGEVVSLATSEVFAPARGMTLNIGRLAGSGEQKVSVGWSATYAENIAESGIANEGAVVALGVDGARRWQIGFAAELLAPATGAR